jgi:hypothetical protein
MVGCTHTRGKPITIISFKKSTLLVSQGLEWYQIEGFFPSKALFVAANSPTKVLPDAVDAEITTEFPSKIPSSITLSWTGQSCLYPFLFSNISSTRTFGRYPFFHRY